MVVGGKTSRKEGPIKTFAQENPGSCVPQLDNVTSDPVRPPIQFLTSGLKKEPEPRLMKTGSRTESASRCSEDVQKKSRTSPVLCIETGQDLLLRFWNWFRSDAAKTSETENRKSDPDWWKLWRRGSTCCGLESLLRFWTFSAPTR